MSCVARKKKWLRYDVKEADVRAGSVDRRWAVEVEGRLVVVGWGRRWW
jgi:predicted DNA-binding WGR domain protein